MEKSKPHKGVIIMNIQKIIKNVSIKDIEEAQKKAKKHFESGHANGPMNMIAFD